VLLLALVLGGPGFAAHVIRIIAVVVFVTWLAGFAFGGEPAAGRRARWYRRW
jgi:hypothetical protein